MLLGLLASAAATTEQAPTWEAFVAHAGHDPFLATGIAIYLTAVAAALAEVTRSCWTYATTLNDRPDTRLGLRLLAAGALVGIAYTATLGLLLADQRLPTTIPPTLAVTLRLLAVGGGTLGASVPLLARVLADYRTYDRLHALHQALRRTTESIVESLQARLTIRDLSWHSYQHIDDIRAGWLDLRAWMTPEQADAARRHGRTDGLGGQALDAYTQARLLLQATASRAHDHPPAGVGRSGALPGGTDRHTEVACLRTVARYITVLTATRHRRGLTTAP